jgi:hypothetical protein
VILCLLGDGGPVEPAIGEVALDSRMRGPT